MNNAIFNNIMELVEKLKLELSYLPLRGTDYKEVLQIYKPKSEKGNFVTIFFYKDENISCLFIKDRVESNATQKLLEEIENPSYLDLLLKFNYYL